MGFAIVVGVGFSYRPAFDLLFGVIVGAGFGLTQWIVIRRRVSHANWWPVTCVFGWTLGVFAGQMAANWWLGPSANFVAERALLGAIIGVITGSCQWFVIRRTFPQGFRWIVGSTAGYAVALVVHGLVIFAVGDPLVRGLSSGIYNAANWAPMVLLPFAAGAVAAPMAWFALRRLLPGATWWVLAGLAIFWVSWTLLEMGPGAQEIGKGVAVALLAMVIGAIVGISTGVTLVGLIRLPAAGTAEETAGP
ncbi:MAG: hypothetical protein BZY80_06645 [SAR202 cluster bacterium Io17-Chloro-G2]|nr:MAG: hypothetical protein BZY80_06645 [SAR202 cluster bacterium Io17-Chloro-G2]